jgi:hypothetical protein
VARVGGSLGALALSAIVVLAYRRRHAALVAAALEATRRAAEMTERSGSGAAHAATENPLRASAA